MPPRSGERPSLRVGVLSTDLKLDGKMDEPEWAAADSIANLIMTEPREGGVPAGRTVVKVLADPHFVVIGVQCFDPDPRKIVSFSKGRDADLSEEDNLVVVIDPFRDGRTGYVFEINPAGARYDGLVAARGEEVNSDWDTFWEARTCRDGNGWCSEIRIPIASLAFKKGATTWGFNIQRHVQRLQETSRWSGAIRDYEVYQTSHAGLLTHLPEFDLGTGLTVRPAGVARYSKPAPHHVEESDENFSLDATQRIGPTLLSSLTVNTDFSETEVDVQRINLTRFPISFPEKRTFFLSGADIFEFGLGLDEETLLPFYTRRIGLFGSEEEDLAQVPIDWGAKINGRIGSPDVGALVVNTQAATVRVPGVYAPDTTVNLPYTTMGAVRIKQDIFAESAVGLLATFGDPMGRNDSWSSGADFTYQTSRLFDDKNFLAGAWGMTTNRADLTGDRTAYGARLDFPNDELDVTTAVTRIGEGFDPSLGFVPRRGVQIFNADMAISARPGWITNKLLHELGYNQFVNRRSGRWESYTVTVTPVNWLFNTGDQILVSFEPQGDRLDQQFEVYPDIDIAPGSYEWTRNTFTVTTAAKRRLSGSYTYENGGYYTGNLLTRSARLTIKPSSLLTVEFTGERTHGTVLAPENESIQLFVKSWTQDLVGLRVEINISPDLQLSSFTQYESETRQMGSNNRIRWTFRPNGDLFIVYNDNEIRKPNKEWRFVSSEVPIKIQYTWRF